MKKSELLVELIKKAHDLQDELQIVTYELTNKPHFPKEFHILKGIDAESLEFKIKLVEDAIKEENKKIGNPPINDMKEFLINQREIIKI